MKSLHPAKPWGKNNTLRAQAIILIMLGSYARFIRIQYLFRPESLVVPSGPPLAEQTVEDQPFVYGSRNSNNHILARVFSLTASQLIEQEALSPKYGIAASNALSMAEYIYKYLGMPEGAQIVLHLKLDLVACCNFSWREDACVPFYCIGQS